MQAACDCLAEIAFPKQVRDGLYLATTRSQNPYFSAGALNATYKKQTA
jgi:hypothetical protein